MIEAYEISCVNSEHVTELKMVLARFLKVTAKSIAEREGEGSGIRRGHLVEAITALRDTSISEMEDRVGAGAAVASTIDIDNADVDLICGYKNYIMNQAQRKLAWLAADSNPDRGDLIRAIDNEICSFETSYLTSILEEDSTPRLVV